MFDSIKDESLINPFVVYQNQNGSHTPLDDHRRYKILELVGRAGTNQVPCVVVDKHQTKLENKN